MNVKIKIYLNFFSSSGIGTGRVKVASLQYKRFEVESNLRQLEFKIVHKNFSSARMN